MGRSSLTNNGPLVGEIARNGANEQTNVSEQGCDRSMYLILSEIIEHEINRRDRLKAKMRHVLHTWVFVHATETPFKNSNNTHRVHHYQ